MIRGALERDIAKKIYWIRIITGTIIGMLSGVLKLVGMEGITVAVVAYIATYYIFKLKYKELPPRHYIIGLPEYIGLWLTLWSISFTLLFHR